MSINYNDNIISVSSSFKEKNLLVYAHPGDKITFDFDISTLEKEVINGDLIIRLLNGSTITVVNFGLMALDNKAPILEDTSQSYNPFSLFGGYAYFEDNGISNYVVSRQISSPDNSSLAPGESYSTAKDIANGEGSSTKEVGDFITPEQSAIPEFAPMVQDYIIKTFQHPHDKTFESTIIFTSKNNYHYNEVDPDVLPVKLLLINPKITPEYGAYHFVLRNEAGPHKEYEDLYITIGGGKLKGDDFAYFMYKPETINYSTKLEEMWFDGPKQSDNIVRYFYVGVPSQSINITQVVISGLPPAIKVPEKMNPNLEVKPLGSGVYEIKVRGSAPGGIDIPITYPLGMGGEDGVFAAVGISFEGRQVKTGDLIRGGNIAYFEFKPVRSDDDISNFSKFNTYTFSTLRDPLIIYFGLCSDVIKGGKGDYTYYGNAGDNLAYGGEATEIFHLGNGNNKFYAGIGNDTVDVDDVNKDNRLYLSDGIQKADFIKISDSITLTSTSTYLDEGKIWFGGKYKGKDFLSSMQDFSKVYFDIGDNNQEIERDDIFQIKSTTNLKSDIFIDLGKGNNSVKGAVRSLEIKFKPYDGGKKLPFITTDNTATGVYIKWGGGNNKIIGSTGNDVIIGLNDNEKIYFDGNEGYNTSNYSAVTVDMTYNAATGVLNKQGYLSDEVVGIQKIIGSASGTNVFYGAVKYKNYKGDFKDANITYIGGKVGAKSTLSYEKLDSKTKEDRVNNGVIIDMVNFKVIKIKTGGIDHFQNISNLISSNNNDTFIVANEVQNNNFNGLCGFNVIDYSNLGVDVVFNLNQDSAGTVTKGGGSRGVDIINNFRHFIGSSQGSNFILNAYASPKDNLETSPYRFIVEGRGSNNFLNKINYSSINGQSIVLDLRLGKDGFLATLYKGLLGDGSNNLNQDIVGIDNIFNVGVFSLSLSAKNLVYMYNESQLNYIIDAGSNGDNTISFEKRNSAVKIDFDGNDYKNNLNNFKTLKLNSSNNSIKMGSGFFAEEIDGGSGISSIDFSSIIIPIITEIDLNNIELTGVNISSKIIKVKNFQHIKTTNADDNITIKFDLKSIDLVKNKDINIDGSLGFNTINFKEVKDSGNQANGLTIDLSSDLAIVKDVKNNMLLKFSNFNRIVGSQGNDIFILPAVAFSFEIDGFTNGPNASNAVSYQMYDRGVHITDLILKKFTNIQKIIGSQGNDTITLTEKTNLQVDGFSGFNSAIYKAVTESGFKAGVNVNILDDSLTVTKGTDSNKTVDTLRKVNLVSFAEISVDSGVSFVVKNKSNSAFSSDGKLFLSGSKFKDNEGNSKDKIDYSVLSEGVTLNLDVQGDLPATGYWLNVVKSNNNIDYFKNIGNIKLSDKSKIYVYDSIKAYTDSKTLNIDGIKNSSLSFAYYNSSVVIDVKQTSLNFGPNLIKITGITSFEGVAGFNFTTKFISDDENSYIFDGLFSKSSLSYSNVTGNVSVTITKGEGKNYNNLSIKKTKFTDNAINIKSFEGSSGDTSIFVNDNINQDMSFKAKQGANNSIDYSKIINVDILSFMISHGNIKVGRFSGVHNDSVVNFTKVTGSGGNSRFDIDSSLLTAGTKYTLDGGGGSNTVNLGTFNANLTIKIENEKNFIKVTSGSNDVLELYNMHYIWGSVEGTNTFILGNIYNKHYFTTGTLTINGSHKNRDTLNLKDTKKSLILDPLSGRISLNEERSDSISLIAAQGIHTIDLGDGDHQLDISTRAIGTSWKVINGGAGKNSISFAKMLSGIKYELHKGIDGGGTSLTITNFDGVTGSRGNDTFTLRNEDAGKKAVFINGNGGSLNTLDFSELSVKVTVNIPNNQVTRGSIADTVLNMQVLKTGIGGADFISQFKGSYQFIGHNAAIDKNSLSYAGVEENITFNFITNSVVKGVGNNSDKFENISKIVGGSKHNNFLFVTKGLPHNLTTITLDGSAGTNNIVNLSQLEFGITYIIKTKSFTVSVGGGKQLTVKLENIHQIIGTSEADTFIFSDDINNFMANGGNNRPGIKDTADLSEITTGVTVDFSNRTIVFGSNRNTFLNIDKFIGSKNGNNIFKGLSTNTQYEIDGGATSGDKGNTLSYSGASVGLVLTVVNGEIKINKGGITDTFKNIQNLELSNLSDRLIFNKADDLNVYKTFKKIDGGAGLNFVIFSEEISKNNNISVDLSDKKITIGANTQTLQLYNFYSWNFGGEKGGTQAYSLKVSSAILNLDMVMFSKNSTQNSLDISKVEGDLNIIADQLSSTFVIISPYNSKRTNVMYLNTLHLGNNTYTITYNNFRTEQGSLKIVCSENTKFNINITRYDSDKTIVFSGNTIVMGASEFKNVNILDINSFSANRLNLDLRQALTKDLWVKLGEYSTDKVISLKNSISNSVVSFFENNRLSVAHKDSPNNNVLNLQYKGVSTTEMEITSNATLLLKTFSPAIHTVKDNIGSSTEKLTIDLTDLPITGSPVYVKLSFASKDIKFALNQGTPFFRVDLTNTINKEWAPTILGSKSNNDIIEVPMAAQLELYSAASYSSTKTLIINATESNNNGKAIIISANRIYSGSSGDRLNILLKGGSTPNRIELKGRAADALNFTSVEVQHSKGLEHVNLGLTVTSTIDFRSNTNINNMLGILSFSKVSNLQVVNGNFNYLGGKFSFTNAVVGAPNYSNVGLKIYMPTNKSTQVMLNNNGQKADLSTLNLTQQIHILGTPSKGGSQTFSFSDYTTGATDLIVYLKPSAITQVMLWNKENQKWENKFFLEGYTNIFLQITNAKTAKTVFNVNQSDTSEPVNGAEVNLGSLEDVTLPTIYQIMCANPNNRHFKPTSVYPKWSPKYSSGMSFYIDDLVSYNNLFLTELYGVNGDFIINGNNDTILFHEQNESSFKLSGFNMFAVKNFSSTKSLRIHELSKAKPFNIMAFEALTGTVDFSSVNDGGTYAFRFIPGRSTKDIKNNPLLLITNQPNNWDQKVFEPGSETKIYGSVTFPNHVILSSGTNYVHAAQHYLGYNDPSVVEGGFGKDIFVFNVNEHFSNKHTFSIKIQQDGFKIGRVSSYNINKPVDAVYEKTVYKNIKYIQAHDIGFYSIFVEFNSNMEIPPSIENVYFLVRAKNDDGSFVRGRGFHIVDTYQGSYKLSLFMHKDATVITKADFMGVDRAVSFVVKDGSLAALDGSSRIERIALSYELDFNSYQYLNGQTIYINPRIEKVLVPEERLRNYKFYHDNYNTIELIDRNNENKKVILKADIRNTQFIEVPNGKMNEYLVENSRFFDIMKENPNEGLKYDNNGSVYKLGKTLWLSENKYLENLNKDSSTVEYWKNLDSRIDSALKEEGRYARDVYNKENVNENTNNNKENYPSEEPQLIWDEEMELENNNSNHNFENDIDNSEEDIILKEEPNIETEDTNYLDKESNSEDLYLDTENNINNNNSYNDVFDLNAVLESAKELDSLNNNSNILEELGANNISSEVLENMYQVDEANSMAYTIDTGNNSFFGDSTLDGQSESTNCQEQQKKQN